jgi:uncharacterized membrane protein
MKPTRLEAFSDGVIAIVITIMVLELRAPEGAGLNDLLPLLPVFLAYVLSFVFLSIYWNNHHHLIHATRRVSGGIMWANINLLFWLSIIPFTTSWMSEHPGELWPTVLYGINLLMPGFAFRLLVSAIIREHGPDSDIARAIGSDLKGYASLFFYVLAIAVAFFNPWISYVIYAGVAVIWLIPDRRVEGIGREKADG